MNLATEAALSESPVVRDVFSLVNELGVLSSQSGKFQVIFSRSASSRYERVAKIRPLCPTRWTVRAKAIRHVLDQYESILAALDEMSQLQGDAATRAAGLLTKFQQSNTFVLLCLAADIIVQLEILNSSLQSKSKTMSGMKAAIGEVVKSLMVKRGDAEHLNKLFEHSFEKCSDFDLYEIKVPRKRQPSKRFSGPSEAFQPANVQQYLSIQYYKLIDTASSKLQATVNQEGTVAYGTLEFCLLNNCMNDKCKEYPELDIDLLRIQLEMFKRQFAYSTMDEAAIVMRCQVPEVRKLFSQVEIMVRLLLVIPVTSCEAERSFSGLRRLKTWLRSTMTQERLNNVAVCNVHHGYIDGLNLKTIVTSSVQGKNVDWKCLGNFEF